MALLLSTHYFTSIFLPQVFCVHGGIPMHSFGDGLISSINDIPTYLPDPIEQSQLAWDIMWNDPIRFENNVM